MRTTEEMLQPKTGNAALPTTVTGLTRNPALRSAAANGLLLSSKSTLQIVFTLARLQAATSPAAAAVLSCTATPRQSLAHRHFDIRSVQTTYGMPDFATRSRTQSPTPPEVTMKS